MTAINAGGYGLIYLTPNQMIDFGDGPATIRFDVSTQRMSKRDWIDLWLSPWDSNLALPFDQGEVDLQGGPQTAVHVYTGNSQNSPILNIATDGQSKDYGPFPFTERAMTAGIAEGTNQSAVRQPLQLTISTTHIKFERLASPTAPALVFIDTEAAVPFSRAVVQFGHHSYNPTKDGSGVPATWHWDNIEFSNAVPFGVTRSIERYADEANPTLHFAEPSGAGAMLRFGGIGKLQISTDGGRTWATPKLQDGTQQLAGNHHAEHMSSYWTPVPEGTREVRFRFAPDDWYRGPYLVEGAAIWTPPRD
jgi:hypothetical protein